MHRAPIPLCAGASAGADISKGGNISNSYVSMPIALDLVDVTISDAVDASAEADLKGDNISNSYVSDAGAPRAVNAGGTPYDSGLLHTAVLDTVLTPESGAASAPPQLDHAQFCRIGLKLQNHIMLFLCRVDRRALACSGVALEHSCYVTSVLSMHPDTLRQLAYAWINSRHPGALRSPSTSHASPSYSMSSS